MNQSIDYSTVNLPFLINFTPTKICHLRFWIVSRIALFGRKKFANGKKLIRNSLGPLGINICYWKIVLQKKILISVFIISFRDYSQIKWFSARLLFYFLCNINTS